MKKKGITKLVLVLLLGMLTFVSIPNSQQYGYEGKSYEFQVQSEKPPKGLDLGKAD